MTKFAGLRAKTYSYLRADGSEDKSKSPKKVCYKKYLHLRIIKTVYKHNLRIK